MERVIARICAILLICVSLTGCIADNSTTQYVRDGYYRDSIHLPDATIYFRFKVPQYHDPYEYSKMATVSRQDRAGAYITLGPAGFDRTIYNIAIGPKPKGTSFDADDTFAARWQHKLFERRFSKSPKRIVNKRIDLNGHPAVYSVYKQYVQAQRGLYYRSEAQTLTYLSYTIDYGKYLLFFQAQAAGKGETNVITPRDRRAIMAGRWPPLMELINSFSLIRKSSAPIH